MNPSINRATSNHVRREAGTRTTVALAAPAQERASLLGLLVPLFRDGPSPPTLQAMRDPALRNALGEAGIQFGEAFFTANLEQLTESLAVEFATLFLLPGSMISPHESVQVKGGSGLLRGPETAQVKEYYEYVGFVVDESCAMEPDHISIELEFLRHLAKEEASAWQAGDHGRALDALRYQDDFLRRHLGKWVYGFLARIEQHTESNFYREVALLTNAYLREQQETLPERISRWGG
jgi:TorA maturation chaperone TorD